MCRRSPTRIVEQADSPPIPDEEIPDTIERNDPPLRAATGQRQDVDAVIGGQVLEGKVTSESKRTGQGESVYQDGYRRQPNPDRVPAASALDAAVQELERCRHQLAEAEARLERFQRVDPRNPEEVARRRKAQAEVDEAKRHLVHAADDVGAAKVRLASIPPEVLVPNMVKHQYPIETFTWTAKVVCMVKMLDTATGEVLCAERVEGQESRSDRTVAADPSRNVPEDPLVLPSESTLLEAAANSALVKIRQTLSQACARHGQRFLSTMQRAEASGDTVRAVDNGIKYLFAYPTGDTHANAIVDSLRRYLADEDGLLDVRAILRTHCHVLPGADIRGRRLLKTEISDTDSEKSVRGTDLVIPSLRSGQALSAAKDLAAEKEVSLVRRPDPWHAQDGSWLRIRSEPMSEVEGTRAARINRNPYKVSPEFQPTVR